MAEEHSNLPADAPWWARCLADEWRDCWKWLSTWLVAIASAAPLLYQNVEMIQQAVPVNVYHWIQSGLTAIIFLSLIKTKPGNGKTP